MKTDSPSTVSEKWLNLPPFPDQRAAKDPISRLIYAGSELCESYAPMVKMEFKVKVRGGLAMVEVTRTYVNKLDEPIEAIMSIPVPVQAAFYGLSAVIGGKRYDAQVRPKDEAREAYEEAIDQGQAAVLHEELLRGIHSVSVGNLGAGQTAIITSHWAESLRFFGSMGQLRIPLTVGDVYGVSPLEDVDTLETGGPVPRATLRIVHDAAGIELASGKLQHEDGGGLFARVPGNAPIEIRLLKPQVSTLTGIAVGGRRVELRIQPESAAQERLNAAILVDRSGSMSSPCEGTGSSHESKHAAVVRGLRELVQSLCNMDRVGLWEFDDSCNPVGRTNRAERPESFARSLSYLGQPRGGTRIGYSLWTVVQAEPGADILLITDGQSYDLDVQELALAGHRIFVVLVGEGSLEARVGHLAALTGGDVHFSYGDDVGTALHACIQGMRQKRADETVCRIDEAINPVEVQTSRCNAVIRAKWSPSVESEGVPSGFVKAVAAYAASLAFAGAHEGQAEAIAISEGLVTHLTSLVLVAEDAPVQKDLPKTIKQSLATTRTASSNVCYFAPPDPDPGAAYATDRKLFASPPKPARQGIIGHDVLLGWVDWSNIEWLGAMIDWNMAGPELAKGVMDGLPRDIANMIRDLSVELEGIALQFGVEEHELVIALAALAASKSSRPAARVYKRLMVAVDTGRVEAFAHSLGCQT